MDNRLRDKSESLKEIESDETPLDEEALEQERKEEEAAREEAEIEESKKKEQALEEQINATDNKASDEEIIEEEKSQQQTTPVKEEKQQLPPIEERYKHASTEAQILNEQNKQLITAIDSAELVKEPTEEEMTSYARSKGFDYDELSPFEKAMLKDTVLANRKLGAVTEGVKSIREIDNWAKKVDTFLEENETKQEQKGIIGREAEFRAFAMKEGRRGVPFEFLAAKFIQDFPTPVKKKSALFATQGGGQRVEAKKTVDDADKVKNIRNMDQKAYTRLLKAKKIDLTSDL